MKVHVIHVLVDGQNQKHIENFQTLVAKFIAKHERSIDSVDFKVTPIFSRDAVRMTAIIMYREDIPGV